MMKFFQFTLGPVQSFVAQARRTRDFWAGSFLLSYLTGKAMMAVLNTNESNKIVFPVAEKNINQYNDKLLEAIYIHQKTGEKDFPTIGSIPNRFLAEVTDDFSGQICLKAVNNAWQAMAEEIWDKYMAPVSDLGCGTEKIWERQIDKFWEMSWVFGEETDLLDRRKNWRSHIPPEEPGDKCTLMGNWQELSGYMRVADRTRQDKFWKELYHQTPGEDLRDNERLCSIAYIKRLFPYVLQPKMISYPSTPYLASVPWLSSIINDATKHETVHKYVGAAHNKMFGHENSAVFFEKSDLGIDLDKFVALDGNCFFKSTLENDDLWPDDISEECRCNMVGMLEKLKPEAVPFYALLIMDGDRIGSLLAQKDKRINISQALSSFSGKVEEIISKHKGITIYAGGDDVLALLPMDKALNTAAELRDSYTKCFNGMDIEATISAGIVYAHQHAPLRQIITEAHRVLDEEAKEKTGRGALAVAVWKTGGTVINWSAPWEVQHTGNITMPVVDKINSLISQYGSRQISNSWLYGIRRLLGNLKGNEFELDGNIKTVQLLAADLIGNRETDIGIKQAEEIVQDLLTVCLKQRRDGTGKIVRNEKIFSLDGGLLIKFLATKGVA